MALLPIGFPLGAWTPGDDIELCIRLGVEIVTVAPAEYDTWWQARWTPDPGDLARWARAAGADHPGRIIEALATAGLLADPARDEFPGTHRLLPHGVGYGLGSEPGGGDLTICDTTAQPAVKVDPLTYAVWSLCDGVTDLATATARAASTLGIAPAAATGAVRAALPVLVEVGVATVDRPVTR
jgi:hypothetical protein